MAIMMMMMIISTQEQEVEKHWTVNNGDLTMRRVKGIVTMMMIMIKINLSMMVVRYRREK